MSDKVSNPSGEEKPPGSAGEDNEQSELSEAPAASDLTDAEAAFFQDDDSLNEDAPGAEADDDQNAELDSAGSDGDASHPQSAKGRDEDGDEDDNGETPEVGRGAQAQAAADKAKAAAEKALATQRGESAESTPADNGDEPSLESVDAESSKAKRKKARKKKGQRSKQDPKSAAQDGQPEPKTDAKSDTKAASKASTRTAKAGAKKAAAKAPSKTADGDPKPDDEPTRTKSLVDGEGESTDGAKSTDTDEKRVGPVRRAGRLLIRLLFLGAFPGAIFYGGLFGLCIWLHRSVEYMGVEDTNTASRVLALFEDEIVAQQLGFFLTYMTVGALAGLVAFAFWELLSRVRGRPITWWVHLLATFALTFAIHGWFMMRSAYHYPQLYSTQTQNSLLLDILFSLGVDGFEPWFLNLVSVLFWCAMGGMALWLVYRWSVREADARGRSRKTMAAMAGLAAGAGLAVLAGSGDSFSPPKLDTNRPNVLVIAVDSLRGDVVGDGSITPNIDRFALRGTRFTHAFSVMPRTFPAWATILTGQYPHTHGIRHMFPKPDVGDKVRGTLPEVLADAGYRTAVISDFAGDVFTRGDFGFEHLDAPEFTLRSNVRLGGLKLHVHLMPYLVDVLGGKGVPELAANERLGDPRWLTDKALEWIQDGSQATPDPDKPFFLTVFYSAGHFPFAAPAPFYRKYADPNYRGRSRFHKEAYGKPLEGPARAAEEKHLRHLFLGALAASDQAIGHLLKRLEDSGVLDNTIVVITADHGENLYEHGLGVGHGDHLYGLAGVHVPLIVAMPSTRAPESRRKIAPEAVRLVDIAPTILAELGVKPQVKPEGVDLKPYIERPAKPLPSLPAFAETGLWFYPPETDRLEGKMIRFSTGFDAFRYQPDTWKIYLDPIYEETAIMAKHRMLLDGDRKLLYIPTRGGVRWEMFDTYSDPGETVNLVDIEPERFEAMKAKLMEWMLKDPQMVRVGDYVLPRGPLGPVAEHTAPP